MLVGKALGERQMNKEKELSKQVLEKMREYLAKLSKEEKEREDRIAFLKAEISKLESTDAESLNGESATSPEVIKLRSELKGLEEIEQQLETRRNSGMKINYVFPGMAELEDRESILPLRYMGVLKMEEVSLWGMRKYWFSMVFFGGGLLSGMLCWGGSKFGQWMAKHPAP